MVMPMLRLIEIERQRLKLRINPTIFKAKTLLLRYHWYAAAVLVLTFFGLSFGAMLGDSAIVDELAHVPAAYSYVHYGDDRLNPEHPPLLKDLAGIPLQFLGLNFPTETGTWNSNHPEQYSIGYEFLYRYGNDAKTILFWARLPLLLLASLFGLVFYAILWRRFGIGVALLALFFYSLSPNFLAHSHYVTTDVGASIGMFISLILFIRYLERPTRWNIVWLSLGLALAQLTKFSSVLLYPFMLFVWIGIVALRQSNSPWKLLRGIIIGSLVSFFWIYLFYVPNTIALSAQRQSDLFVNNLAVYENLYHGIGPFLARLCIPVTTVSILRPLLEYILGMGMVAVRVGSGNVAYFNGMVSLQSFHGYFPEIFLLKTQIPFLILLASIPFFTGYRFLRHRTHSIRSYLKYHRFEIVMASFVIFYFTTAVLGNLNIGIRHILPIYPPLFALVALGTVRIIRSTRSFGSVRLATLAVLMLWYSINTFTAYPYFTAYFNNLGGGPDQAYRYFSDSGIDWGQDLYRLKTYTDNHPEITTLALDYFGGGMAPYTFCTQIEDSTGHQLKGDAGIDCRNSIYREWHAGYGKYHGQYIAVSETYLINDLYYAGREYPEGYAYLRKLQPIAKVGHSIYVYKLY